MIRKIVLWVATGLLAVLLVAGVLLGFFLDSLIRNGIETFGPQVARVAVNVADVDLSLFTGRARVDGLVVGNPSGSRSPHALSVNSTRVSVRLSSVLSRRVVVEGIHVEGLEVTYEGGPGSNNLTRILANVEANNRGAPRQQQGPDRRFYVRELALRGGRITMASASGPALTIPLPDIHLKELGRENGLTAGELAQHVLAAIAQGTALAVAGAVGSGMASGGAKAVGGLRDVLRRQ